MKIHEQNEVLNATLLDIAETLEALKLYLNSSKFQGTGEDGMPNSYVNVNDVLLRLQETDAALVRMYDSGLKLRED